MFYYVRVQHVRYILRSPKTTKITESRRIPVEMHTKVDMVNIVNQNGASEEEFLLQSRLRETQPAPDLASSYWKTETFDILK